MERRVLLAVSLAVLLPGIGPGTSLAGTRLIPSDQIIVTGADHFSCEEIAEKLSQSLLNHRVYE